jgi:cytochrome c-type biogenesis protein CcmF
MAISYPKRFTMIPELAHLALCLCLALAVLQACMPWLQRFLPHAQMHTRMLSVLQCMLLTLSFAGLLISYAVSDFSVLNVVLNSHTEKPFIYKLTGAWGNHEGSMLLWVWVLGFFGALVALLPTQNAPLRHTTLIVHSAILSGFLLFILLTSNPFIRVFPPPLNGEDLNPLLQDIGLALHPPLLYLGYVGFGIVFAFAMAGMKLRCLNAAFARIIHPWILFTWGCLTAGIGHGQLVGLPRARLGWLVVLGPRRKRIATTVAHWNGTAARQHATRKTRSMRKVGSTAGHSYV